MRIGVDFSSCPFSLSKKPLIALELKAAVGVDRRPIDSQSSIFRTRDKFRPVATELVQQPEKAVRRDGWGSSEVNSARFASSSNNPKYKAFASN